MNHLVRYLKTLWHNDKKLFLFQILLILSVALFIADVAKLANNTTSTISLVVDIVCVMIFYYLTEDRKTEEGWYDV